MLREVAQWVMYAGMGVAMVGGATWPRPSAPLVAAGIAVIAAGILLRRRAGAPTVEHSVAAGSRPERRGTLAEGIADAARATRELADQAETLTLEAIKERVEGVNWLGAERLGAAQELVAAREGFAVYAEVMAPLATSERLLYRAWSAASDGHRPEVVASLRASAGYAEEAAELAREKLGRGQ